MNTCIRIQQKGMASFARFEREIVTSRETEIFALRHQNDPRELLGNHDRGVVFRIIVNYDHLKISFVSSIGEALQARSKVVLCVPGADGYAKVEIRHEIL